jgi:hypothetical protein
MKRNDKIKRGISIMDDKKKEKKGRTNECKSKCANRNMKIYREKQMKEEKQKKEKKKSRKKVEKEKEENRKMKQ